MSAGNNRAAYMREVIVNNVPKRTKLNAQRQREYRDTYKNISAEYMRNYRERRPQENKIPQASTSTEPTPTSITYNYNQAIVMFE
jgi:hypothetical protein